MASLDLLLESLNKEDKKTRRVPNRTISGDTLDSIKNHRRNNYKPPPRPVDGAAGPPQRTNMSRRGARRPSKTGGGPGGGGAADRRGSALTTFVESMNESSRSFAEPDALDMDVEEETVDSRQLTADKQPQLKASARRGDSPGQAIIEEDARKESDEDDDEDSEESEEDSEESEEESSEEESEVESSSEEDSDEEEE
jgi:hypothetical protein